jgi:hypothetical protein
MTSHRTEKVPATKPATAGREATTCSKCGLTVTAA